MATIKHVASKNADYSAAESYLIFQHDEYTGLPLLDENGNPLLRDAYLLSTLECGEEDFALACLRANRKYHKNGQRGDVKSHQYIISFDPRDKTDNGLTLERAQALGVEFCQKNFPGHQAIICAHPDGHNQAGNIHVHIVINSLRIREIERQPYMEKPCDWQEGMKHRCTAACLRYLRGEVMELCQREGLYQIDLLNGATERITEREYWAQQRGQRKLDRQNEALLAAGEQPPTTKFETEKAALRQHIRAALALSTSYDEFVENLAEKYGITVK
jgi:hypothetical protein